MKKYLYMFMLLAAVSFAACSDDEGSYNPDKAESTYIPSAGRKVASLHTTHSIDSRDYSWKHNFSYDAKGRIKEVHSVMKEWEKYTPSVSNLELYKECDITSTAHYYYYGDKMDVKYSVKYSYPDYPSWNYSVKYTDSGVLNADGYISRYVAAYNGLSLGFECQYRGDKLDEVNYDGGYKCEITRDESSCVNGYIYTGDEGVTNNGYIYENLIGLVNRTNLDFSAYFGYWGHERYIGAMSAWTRASYQLAAFGFFGARNQYLPLWKKSDAVDGTPWSMQGGYPVKYTSPSGVVTEITYID